MTAAIIVAAGRGTRMGASVDKLFLPVAGRPLIAHTWERFESAAEIDEIVLVIRPEQQTTFNEIGARWNFRKPARFVPGGKERQDSVWNGLEALSAEAELVAIHDGARPCTPAAIIGATLEAARQTGAAVAAQRVTDTVKESADGRVILRHLDRSRLWAVQTPQCFRVEVIRKALSIVRERGVMVTDDTAACEGIGQPVALVECRQPNPKLTMPEDVPYLEWVLETRTLDRGGVA